MILHTVNKNTDCLLRCLALCTAGDAILLLEDGVYAALDNTENRKRWQHAPEGLQYYILDEDALIRGVSGDITPIFEKTDWHSFVSLSLVCDKVISWG